MVWKCSGWHANGNWCKSLSDILNSYGSPFINLNPNMVKKWHRLQSVGLNNLSIPFPCWADVEVWEWMNNYMPHVTVHVFTHPCLVVISKRGRKWIITLLCISFAHTMFIYENKLPFWYSGSSCGLNYYCLSSKVYLHFSSKLVVVAAVLFKKTKSR